jgi:uncharacterized membrane protein YagU involved in acid resistance
VLPATRLTAADLFVGAIAGLAATAAMTVAADAMFKRLPEGDRYPLPPRELTEHIVANVGAERELSEPTLQLATLISHFGFGAVAGCLYATAVGTQRLPPVLGGIGYGLAIWTTSYLGWIPALRLLRPATHHPAPRNALMITAHVVWGSVLGLLFDRLSASMSPLAAGQLRDR